VGRSGFFFLPGLQDYENKGVFPKDWENPLQSGILGGNLSVPVSISKREEFE
jgi:hypothetical protein